MKLVRDLEINDNVWYKGGRYRVVAYNKAHKYLAQIDNEGYYISDKILEMPLDARVESIASEVYSVGDEIVAAVGGALVFHGFVVGFEEIHNNVICRSLTADDANNRLRYAYKPHEVKIHSASKSEQLEICIYCGGIK